MLGAGLSEPGDGRVNDLLAARLDHVVTEAEPIERAGRKILDEDVGLVD
jgi:hypothetical protein